MWLRNLTWNNCNWRTFPFSNYIVNVVRMCTVKPIPNSLTWDVRHRQCLWLLDFCFGGGLGFNHPTCFWSPQNMECISTKGVAIQICSTTTKRTCIQHAWQLQNMLVGGGQGGDGFHGLPRPPTAFPRPSHGPDLKCEFRGGDPPRPPTASPRPTATNPLENLCFQPGSCPVLIFILSPELLFCFMNIYHPSDCCEVEVNNEGWLIENPNVGMHGCFRFSQFECVKTGKLQVHTGECKRVLLSATRWKTHPHSSLNWNSQFETGAAHPKNSKK